MRLTVTRPALLNVAFEDTDDMPGKKTAQRWTWNRLSDIVEAMNTRRSSAPLDCRTVMEKFAPLCGRHEGIAVLSYIAYTSAVPTSETLHYTEVVIGKLMTGFEFDPRREYLIPAGWGTRLLELTETYRNASGLLLEPSTGEGSSDRLFILDEQGGKLKELSISHSRYIKDSREEP